MQLSYGTYDFNAGEAKVSTNSKLNLSEARVPYSYTTALKCSGYLLVDPAMVTVATQQADLTAKQLALETALRLPYRDLILEKDGGGNSATLLLDSTSLSGVQIIDGPHFTGEGPEYATCRYFEFTAEATYALPNTGNYLIAFQETIAFSGGGPWYICKRALNTPPQRQKVHNFTEYVAVQSGRLISFRLDPKPPLPIWPDFLKHAPAISPVSPKRMGRSYVDYELSWQYTFESPGPLIGKPTRWPLE